MAYVHWESLGFPPQYPCFVERKPFGADDSHYQTITDTGLGLAYADSNVVNSVAYTYRVTALDTNFMRLQAQTNVTPAADGALHVIANPATVSSRCAGTLWPRPAITASNIRCSPAAPTRFSRKPLPRA